MSFAWQDYVTLAEALLQARTTLAPEEACCRTAISRAYYAVYNIARTRAQTHEGLQLPATGDAHQRVIVHYFRGPSPLHRAIGDSLRQLRSVRNRADYDDQFDQAVARAGFVVQRARTLMTQLGFPIAVAKFWGLSHAKEYDPSMRWLAGLIYLYTQRVDKTLFIETTICDEGTWGSAPSQVSSQVSQQTNVF